MQFVSGAAASDRRTFRNERVQDSDAVLHLELEALGEQKKRETPDIVVTSDRPLTRDAAEARRHNTTRALQ